jgi:hypothetical protein
MTYTDANGQVFEASFDIEADIENDNPEIEFTGLNNLFPEPYYETSYKVVSFSKTHIDRSFNGLISKCSSFKARMFNKFSKTITH